MPDRERYGMRNIIYKIQCLDNISKVLYSNWRDIMQHFIARLVYITRSKIAITLQTVYKYMYHNSRAVNSVICLQKSP